MGQGSGGQCATALYQARRQVEAAAATALVSLIYPGKPRQLDSFVHPDKS